MSYYSENPRFYVAVDCIIFGLVEGQLCLLLTRRDFEPDKGRWSLMGGFVQTDESVDNAARRVLSNLTGLRDVYMEQMHTYGEIDRDPGERVVSVAYYALLGPHEYDCDMLATHNAMWVKVNELPELCFDHHDMVARALAMIRLKFTIEPIGFNLLPELFTMTQLQALHESILGCQLDKRNFRKHIVDSGWVEKTSLIDKAGSRRGASLYCFKGLGKS